MAVLKAVSFDFWNTLAKDRAPQKVRRLSAARMVDKLSEKGYWIELEEMLNAFAECREVCYRYQEDLGIDFTPEQQVEWICNFFRIKADRDLKARLIDYYTTSLLEIPPVFEDELKHILETLKMDYKLAIICNTGKTPGWVIKKILSEKGLLHYFDTTSFSNELGIAKPNPRMFLITVERLGVEPSEVVHVGDDIHTDVNGAINAGLKACWYNPEGLKKGVRCNFEVRHLRDIMSLIKNIRGVQ